MTENGIAAVGFPIVILGEAVLTDVRVERMPSLDREARFAAGLQRPETMDILADARAIEPDERRLDGVMVRFLRRDFSGASFGLALALADKRARHSAPSPRVIATGCLPCGGGGTIAAVDGFDAKVRRVLAGLEADSADAPVFAYPAANADDAGEATLNALDQAAQAGRIVLRPARALSDLEDLWRETGEAMPPQRNARRLLWMSAGGVGALLLLLAAAGQVWHMAHEAPLRRCEIALGALDPPEARQDRRRIAAAVDQCAAAARALPQSGRVLFLAGQAHALNGGDRLASAYWRRAALAGDRDGLAAHGRDVWLSGPGDPDSIKAALSFLEKAGAKGSAAALEDMAEIYRDGIGVPADRARAEQLLARARQIRGEPGK
jgi:hypothetical protein